MKSIKIEILDSGKTVIFTTPLSGYDNYLVRTGIIQQNNTLIHAVLTAYSKDYFYMDNKNKLEYYIKFVDSIISTNEYEEDKNNYYNYKLKIVDIINGIYEKNKELSDKKLKTTIKQLSKNPVYDLISEIIPYDDILKILNIDNKKSLIDFSGYNDSIKHEIKNYLNSVDVLNEVEDKDRVVLIKKNIKLIINTILEDVKLYEFNNYKQNILNKADNNLISILMNKIKRDIYIINSDDKLLCKPDKIQEYSNKKALILLKINNSYETIGLLLPENKIQREFESDNYLIKKFKTFLFEPDKIVTTYPELLHYVNKSSPLKNKKNILSESYSDNSDIENDNNDSDDSHN